jgi:hypothetical protein
MDRSRGAFAACGGGFNACGGFIAGGSLGRTRL